MLGEVLLCLGIGVVLFLIPMAVHLLSRRRLRREREAQIARNQELLNAMRSRAAEAAAAEAAMQRRLDRLTRAQLHSGNGHV